ncbi:MAG TPA: ABC transporter ATP-binding protein [Acidobacteriaceae bacterium]|nr:ABC transporter ATP-binding protein [Acidobacteriaceae bacterium]
MPAILAIVRPRLGLLLFALLLIVINRVASLALPYSTKFLIDGVLGKFHPGAAMSAQQLHLLHLILLGVLAATAVQALTSYVVTQLLSKTAWRLITDLRIQVQEHISRLPVAYYDAHRTGNLVSRVMSDVEGVRNLVGTGLIEFAGGLLTALLAFVLLLRISASITLVALGFMALFALVQRKVFAIIRPIARERGSLTAEVTGRLTESLGGVRVVKSYRAESRESAVFAQGAYRLLENVLSAISKTSLTTMASTTVVGVVATVIMFLGARQIFAGSLTLGSYIYLTMLLALMVSPMVQVVSIGTQITEAVAGLDRTLELLCEPREDDDPRRVVSIDKDAIQGHLRFESVSFAYVQDKPVLHEVSLDARPGTVTALVGSSGSGKSTIIGIVSAFYTPQSGRVLLDGVDLSTIQLENYRSRLGVVLQESFLFEGTIRENISFSRPDADPSEVLRAARIARVDEFADRLPQGYETIVGERGIKLSGGQRQRVSIARAILANPRILILDEATSSLDSESEALIQEGLSYLVEGRTTFVIAHRLSTIRSADQILVIEQGRVIEKGNHQELYRRHGRYYDLYTRQHALESNLFLAPGEGDTIGSTEQGAAAEGPSGTADALSTRSF